MSTGKTAAIAFAVVAVGLVVYHFFGAKLTAMVKPKVAA